MVLSFDLFSFVDYSLILLVADFVGDKLRKSLESRLMLSVMCVTRIWYVF